MVKKNLLIAFTALCISTLNAQTITKHGIIANGGIGYISKELKPSQDIKFSDISYKSSYSVGYRFRLNPNINPFFIDIDANIGVKIWDSKYYTDLNLMPPRYSISTHHYFFSIGGTFNYSLYRGLNIGLGIEPTYYFYQDGEKSSNKFDIPLLGKVAYDLGKFEAGLSYKHGLTDIIKTDRIKSGKFREIQLSVFIPF